MVTDITAKMVRVVKIGKLNVPAYKVCSVYINHDQK
jgi:hypothetical protein